MAIEKKVLSDDEIRHIFSAAAEQTIICLKESIAQKEPCRSFNIEIPIDHDILHKEAIPTYKIIKEYNEMSILDRKDYLL